MTDKEVNKSSEKILVIGCPGTGKSTFSKQLGNILNIEVIHLDKYFWKPGWVESSKEEWNETVSKLISKDRWIIDGNYSNTLRLRAEQADEILFLIIRLYFVLTEFSKEYLKLNSNWKFVMIWLKDVRRNGLTVSSLNLHGISIRTSGP